VRTPCSASPRLRRGRPRMWPVAALALALAACAGTEPAHEPLIEQQLPIPRQLELADAALQAGRQREAMERYELILRDAPDHLQARLGLGEAHLAGGASREALAAFTTVLEAPGIGRHREIEAAARQGQGIALLRLDRLAEAHAVLHEVATSDPTLWRAWNALGQSFDSAQEWEQARASYEQALWAAPDAARIHNNLGVSLLRAGAPAAAIDQFGKALGLAPDLAIAQANLRLALAFEGRYLEALAGVPEGELPEALNNVGYIALVRGDHARAEAYFLRALEASPSFFEPAWRNLQYLNHLTQ
jgi:Flp pilus assembly protein TadD